MIYTILLNLNRQRKEPEFTQRSVKHARAREKRIPISSNLIDRRRFLCGLGASSLAIGLGAMPASSSGAPAVEPCLFEVGVCSSSSNWKAINGAGCAYVEESVGKFLTPNSPDADFAKFAEEFKTKGIPVRACNGFLPAGMKLVGPTPSHDEAVAYASKALQRAKLLGIRVVVLGSGGARKIPEGFDRAKAEEQFIRVVGRIGQAAEAANVTVAMESLNRSETNFGNSLRECLRLINAINHPRVRLTADIYHMLREDEGPDALTEAGVKVVHCHLAEKAERRPPGTAGEDFKPYLRALKKVGFRGGISLECRWQNFVDEIGPAVAALKKQIEAVRAEA